VTTPSSTSRGERLHIVVGASLTVPPFTPGTAWDRLQYVLGLRDLGHHVTFVERVEPGWCHDVRGRPSAYVDSENRARFRQITARFELGDDACQVYAAGRATTGLSWVQLLRRIRGADLLLNVSGHLTADELLDAVTVRAYLDQDPVYTQLWDTVHGADLGLDHHDVLLTVGLSIGARANPVPTGGRTWRHCLPPVVVAHWPVREPPDAAPFTTVASFGRYADLEHAGTVYASKRGQFLRFAALPSATGFAFEVALRSEDVRSAEAMALSERGWSIRDARSVADLDAYRDYISASSAEIGIAKGAYVAARSAWVGDRSGHYLASGRPVLAQSTGQEAFLPTGRGLRTFHDLDEAVDASFAIQRDRRSEARAAREIARTHLDHRRVLPALVATAMASEEVGA
jgi:hypothetical protein